MAREWSDVMDETPLREKKAELRRRIRALRKAHPNPATASQRIAESVFDLDAYAAAEAIMCYVSYGSEVATQSIIDRAMQDGKRVVIPYCEDNELGTFAFAGFDELNPGTLGILEPPAELRRLPQRQVPPAEIDLLIIPGLAFDRDGGRLGQGKGYYDRFLPRATGAARVALAFACQLVDAVPRGPNDQRVDVIVTEQEVIRCGE